MTAPVAVEFVGVPGCGKTSLSRDVSRSLRETGVTAFTVIDAARVRAAQSLPEGLASVAQRSRAGRLALWWLFYLAATILSASFVWGNRAHVEALARIQSRRRIGMAMRAHVAWWYLQLAGRQAYLATSSSIEAVLYDDGFVHRSVALFSSPGETPSMKGIDAYLETMPLPDVVVHVRADVDTCLRRVVERGIWKHSSSATDDELSAYLETADQILRGAVDTARERGAVVIEVENGDVSLAEAVATVTIGLESFLAGRTGRRQQA